ncbi:hypothetical protein F7R01_00925 [Pseudomonas argentinensis]|uniref:Uncharacterized protein n=1 Tax=Phytopseudomonas argentinensis TaxID=289370 RepID=A0A1I3NS32_9GAMM|nr:hypothetical protein [Pseudomonas argentinensis]KAB0549818.1 hypothetical protein F7R01_00925 [Pseudomonas argentinensis]SFJ12075.1 hypothetical protein SAMN05216602_3989 [Pseudomonas argentinensis]
MASNWPPSAITGIDPLPYHGLVYTVQGNPQIMLDPMDGRAPVPMPAFYSRYLGENHRMADYAAQQDGYLWDIGMPDPPPSPEIEAAGGKLLGRRIVGGGLFLPVRLGELTRHLFISGSVFDGQVRFEAQLRGGMGRTLAQLPLADVELDWSKAAIEYDGSLASRIMPVPSYGLSKLDISPDGTRHLFGVSLAGLADTAGWATTMVAIIELVLSLDDQGEVKGVATIRRTAAELLGSYSFTVNSDLQRLSSVADGYPSCTSHPVVQDRPNETSGDNGARGWESKRTGVVIGAVYAGDDIDLITASYADQRSETISTTTDSYQWGKPNADSGTCEPWQPGEEPPRPPTRQRYTSTYHYELAFSFRGASIDTSMDSDRLVTLMQPSGGRATGTSVTNDSASAGLQRTLEEEVAPGTLQSLDKLNPRNDAGLIYLPAALWATNYYTVSAVVRRNWVSLATFESYTLTGQPGYKTFWGPLLTPLGVVGETTEYPIRTSGSGLVPNFIYNAAFNPINGQAVRECDMPGRTIAGFI